MNILNKGPINSGTDCFMNATLYAMFGYSGSIFHEYLKNETPLQQEITKVLSNCPCRSDSIRKLLPSHLRFGQQDASEFLDFVCKDLKIEPMTITTIRQVKKNGNSDILKKGITKRKVSFITIENLGKDMSLDDLLEPEWEKLDTPLNNNKGVPTYSLTRNLLFFNAIDRCFIFYFNRTVPKKMTNKIDMPLFINNEYFLFAIVVHMGSSREYGHYVTIIYDTKRYFIYNDLNGGNVEPYNYDPDFVLRNGVLFFYYKK